MLSCVVLASVWTLGEIDCRVGTPACACVHDGSLSFTDCNVSCFFSVRLLAIASRFGCIVHVIRFELFSLCGLVDLMLSWLRIARFRSSIGNVRGCLFDGLLSFVDWEVSRSCPIRGLPVGGVLSCRGLPVDCPNGGARILERCSVSSDLECRTCNWPLI